MITFDFIQKIHRLVKEVPERRKEYEILYPEAFRKEDVTDDLEFKMEGGTFKTFRLYDGEDCIAEIKPFVQTLRVKGQSDHEVKEKKIRSVSCPVEIGYEIDFRGQQSYGFRIYRYGETQKIIKLDSKTGTILEFDPAAEKNRIK